MGDTPAMRRVMEGVAVAAASHLHVLILGESGTGKELVAREIHGRSRRSDQPFEAVRLGSLTATLAGSELFGHVKGAFTGAHRDRTGAFGLAGGGTVFLDEIGDLPMEVQHKLLGVLDECIGCWYETCESSQEECRSCQDYCAQCGPGCDVEWGDCGPASGDIVPRVSGYDGCACEEPDPH